MRRSTAPGKSAPGLWRSDRDDWEGNRKTTGTITEFQLPFV